MRSLGNTDRFIAGAVGEPGKRVFLIEIGAETGTEWFLLEKQQVAALAQRALELLRERGLPVGDPGPDLSDPAEPTFRVAEIAVGADDDDIVVVLSPSDEAPDDPVAVTITTERLGAMAMRAMEVIGAGRPPCRFCGLPKDTVGHACPTSNGDLRDR